MIVRVLERTGATVWARREMYKAVAQSVLLYVSKIWVVTGEMLKVLTAFHHRAAQRITGMTAKRRAGREWEYLAVDEEMNAAGIHPIGVYIKGRKTNIAERVACRPVYSMCTDTEHILGTIWMVRCWDQYVVKDLEE